MDERRGTDVTAVAGRPLELRTAAPLLDGRYRLGPVLARGGMSTVHRATDTRLDRPVAVKVMDPRLAADPVFRARFEREARSAARIDHPAVVDVYDQGTCVLGDGDPVVFLVMELVEGGTLRDVLRAAGPLPVAAAVAVLVPVLDGLAQAHRRGLVHRDVKPENVLISRTGEVKVADFGLVTAAAQAGVSHAGMILGTVAYLSPEQVTTGAADARSDVYAAGVLAYELLTGAPPFTGDTAISVAYRHVHDEVPAPSSAAPGVPAELDDLIVRATRKDPAARPADANAFLAALCRVVERAGIPRVPPPVPPARPEPDGLPGATAATPQRLPGIPGPRGTRALPRDDAAWGAVAGNAPAPPPDQLRLRRRSRRVFGAWVSVVAVLGLVVGTTGWWLGAGRWTEMPTVVGVERASAERLLLAADLVATVTVARHDDVAAGMVSAVDPAPGAGLLRGSTVRLTVSSGRPQVPDVAAGTPVADAERAIRDAGLTPARSGSAREYSATAPVGTVVRTDPAAGTALPGGGRVTLVLSRGAEPPRQVRVPFLVGRTAAEATAALAAAGLQAEIESGFPFGGRPADEAQVVSQSHGPGSMVDRGTTITLRAF
ncbi:MAG: Stk1 family PASTA domain-containing Ser/Thr kinase [Pseudonocardia sp.]